MLDWHIHLEHLRIQGDDGIGHPALAPANQFDFIVPRAAWKTFSNAVEDFYDEVTDAEIARTNEESSKHWWMLFKKQDEAILSGEPRAGFVYVLECNGLYKIGRTKNVERRYARIRQEIPFPVILCGWRKTPNCAELEKSLHGIFADNRATGEWFDLDEVSLEQLKILLMSPKANS